MTLPGDTDDAWALLAATLRGLDADPGRLSVARRVAVRRERVHGISDARRAPSPPALDPPLRPPPVALRPRLLASLLASPPGDAGTIDIATRLHQRPACRILSAPSAT